MASSGSFPPAWGDDTDPVLIELVDELASRLQSGAVLDPEEFLRQHPEHAAGLRRLLPTLRVLVDLTPAGDGADDPQRDDGPR